PVSRCVCPQLINTSTLSLHDALPIYIHYMNVVNPTQGMITGSSRFGALFLKKDGSVQVPYNVRLTQKFYDFFGERVQWMSQKQVNRKSTRLNSSHVKISNAVFCLKKQ